MSWLLLCLMGAGCWVFSGRGAARLSQEQAEAAAADNSAAMEQLRRHVCSGIERLKAIAAQGGERGAEAERKLKLIAAVLAR